MSVGQFMTPRVCDDEYGDNLDPLQISEPYFEISRKRQRSWSIDLESPRMSGYHYHPHGSPLEEDEFDFRQPFTTQPNNSQSTYVPYTSLVMPQSLPQQQFYTDPSQFFPQPAQLHQPFPYPATTVAPAWMTPIVPSNYPMQPQDVTPFPRYTDSTFVRQDSIVAGSSRAPSGYLSPDEAITSRSSRATSFASSNASSTQSFEASEPSRSVSPNASEMLRWGYRNDKGTWSCGFQGCTSRSTFNRGCDLRKHYKRHQKSLFCRHDGCSQATEGGFSSKKDRARHEAKHNPNIVCEYNSEGCDRLFSRVDNMKDHVRRVHRKRKSTQ